MEEDILPTVPAKIGPYVFKGEIGKGAYSTVFLTQNINTKDYFACKLIQRQRLKNKVDYAQFQKEIRIHQQAHHDNIVQLVDLYKDSLNYYVFLEFCSGGELFSYISSRKKIPEEEAAIIFSQILQAILYLHRNRISHRDIKPENILIDECGKIKINDFGMSTECSTRTMCNTYCGTPCYCAPEILQGKPYDGRKADMWSLGIVLYVMVIGKYPWKERTIKGVINQINSGDIKFHKKLSKDCISLITCLINPKPSGRLNIMEAINHPFVKGIKTLHSNPKYSFSLKKLDRFFGYDSEDLEPHFDDIVRCYSDGNIIKTFDGIKREICNEIGLLESVGKTSFISKNRVISYSNSTNFRETMLKETLKKSARIRKKQNIAKSRPKL